MRSIAKIPWPERPLGEVIDIFDHIRVPLNSTQRAERHGQYPYYGASGVIDSVDGFLFDGRYLLIAEDGENLNSRKVPVAFMATGQFWVNNHAHIVRGKPPIADDHFLLYWFAASDISGYITGTAQPKLSQANLKAIRLNLPPLSIQRKITEILSGYDDLVANHARRIAVLEEMAQSLYREWFVRFRFPGHEHAPFIQTELGRVPDAWPTPPLEALQASIPNAINGGPFGSKLGTKDYTPSGVPVIRGGNLSESGRFSDDNFVFVSEEKADELKSNTALPGDIVVTQRGTLGQIGMVPSHTGHARFVVSQSQMKITLDPAKVNILYAFYALKSPEANARIKNLATSSGVPHINLVTLREFQIACPPTDIQARFGWFVEPVEKQITLLNRKIRCLHRTRDLLLPKLISGELDVEHLDIDTGDPESAVAATEATR